MADLPRPLPPPSLADRVRRLADDIDPKAAAGWVLAAAAAAVAVAVAVAALRAADPPPPPELTLPRAGAAGDPAGEPAGGSGGSAGGRTGTTLGETHVHVAGAVARPGLYRLRPGSRVADAVEAAGGAAADADIDQINLAALLVDGERIYVPRKGEVAAPGAAAASGAGAATPVTPVNLNTATLEQLDSLPGIGPATAQAILDHRTRNGRFRTVDDLLDVRGIGPAKLEQLRPLVRV